jgi:hypothetical protein
MTAVHLISGALDDGARRELVYDGDLLVFKDVGPMKELCTLTDAIVREVFDAPDPVRAQFDLDPDDYDASVEEFRRRYRKHEGVKRLFLAALGRIGVDLRRTYWDRLKPRVSAHDDGRAGRRAGTIGFHRDTWGSNVYAQTNWWAPIYPITSGRSLAFYPNYWTRPLKNNSSGWDLKEVRARRRAGKPVAIVPEPEEPVDTSAEVRMVIAPGDLLCFSGAHLHASVPNASGVARFSIEGRTVDAGDEARGRGVLNTDGAAPCTPLDWFRHVSNDTPLTESTLQQMRRATGEAHR